MLLAFQVNAGNIFLEIKNKMTNLAVPNCAVRFNTQVLFSDSMGKLMIPDAKAPLEVIISCNGYFEVKRSFIQITKEHYLIYLIPSSSELKETIITGTATPILATQSVYNVQTVNSLQIAQRGAVTLNDVLNFENNNFISNDNILGSSVSIGGISGQNVKILVNGIALTGRENSNIDLGQINLQNIKRIEMIQGPMSVIYGSNAFGGVLNLITKTPQKPLTFSVRNYTESIGKCNFTGTLGFRKLNHRLQLTIARNFFSGWSSNDSIDRFMQWKPKTQYTSDLNYIWDINKKWNFNYFASFLAEKITNKGAPIINPYEGYAFDEYYRTKRFLQSATVSYTINDHSGFNIMNSFTDYNRIRNRYKKDLVSLEQIPTTSAGDQDSSYFRTFQSRGVYNNSKFLGSQSLIGYELTHENAISTRLSEETKPIADLALFASLLYEKRKWSIQPSVRLITNNLFGKSLTPALHIKRDLSNRLQFRASYARGFRTPTLKEMYLQFIDQNHTILGNESLKPEKGYRSEASLRYQGKLYKATTSLTGMVALNDVQNMILLAVYKGSSVLRQYANLSRYQNVLVNISGTIQWGNISMRQGLGYSKVLANAYVPEYSIWEYSNVFSYHIARYKSTVNINYKYNSKQPVVSTENQFQFTEPIHIANFSIQRSFLNQSLQAQIGIKNIFNLQSSRLNGVTDFQGNAHMSASGLYLFPERSMFLDLNYIF